MSTTAPKLPTSVVDLSDRERGILAALVKDIVRLEPTNVDASAYLRRDLPYSILDAKRRDAFVVILDATLRRLTPADMSRYDLPPDAYSKWQTGWKPELGVRWIPSAL